VVGRRRVEWSLYGGAMGVEVSSYDRACVAALRDLVPRGWSATAWDLCGAMGEPGAIVPLKRNESRLVVVPSMPPVARDRASESGKSRK
jgi:hypothetical protein